MPFHAPQSPTCPSSPKPIADLMASVVFIVSSVHCVVWQGNALFLLERYEEAEAALLEALVLEPGNATLIEDLGKVGWSHRL